MRKIAALSSFMEEHHIEKIRKTAAECGFAVDFYADDRLDMTGKTVQIIDAGKPSSYQVGYSVEENKVADVMREEVVTVEADVPAVQLAKLFVVDNVSQLIITREGKFAGVVELKSFCARLFWE